MIVRRLLLATAAGCALAATDILAIDHPGLGPDAAFAAGNGNGNGNGNDEDRGNGNGNDNDEDRGNGNREEKDRGNGNGGDGGGGNGNGGGGEEHGNGQGAGDDLSVANAPQAGEVKLQGNGGGPQSLNARVAGLHAVNANLQAFIHASPNSRVGEIAAYAMAVVGEENAVAAVDLAQTEFDAASLALADAATAYGEDTAVLVDQYGYTDTSPVALQTSKDALLLTSPSTPEEVAALNAEIAAIDAALASGAELDAAQLAYNDADQALIDAQLAAEGAEALALAALSDAANANRLPVDDEVKLYVDTELENGGVLDFYRAQAPAPVAP